MFKLELSFPTKEERAAYVCYLEKFKLQILRTMLISEAKYFARFASQVIYSIPSSDIIIKVQTILKDKLFEFNVVPRRSKTLDMIRVCSEKWWVTLFKDKVANKKYIKIDDVEYPLDEAEKYAHAILKAVEIGRLNAKI